MIDESIVDNAPKGATHYRTTTGMYYKVTEHVMYFFSKLDNCWKKSLGISKTELKPIEPKGWSNRPSFIDTLPEHVRPHVTEDPKTKELTLWDETGAYEVCKSHYPLVLVAAMEVYADNYLDKH